MRSCETSLLKVIAALVDAAMQSILHRLEQAAALSTGHIETALPALGDAWRSNIDISSPRRASSILSRSPRRRSASPLDRRYGQRCETSEMLPIFGSAPGTISPWGTNVTVGFAAIRPCCRSVLSTSVARNATRTPS
jgi:hypothetical protein